MGGVQTYAIDAEHLWLCSRGSRQNTLGDRAPERRVGGGQQ